MKGKRNSFRCAAGFHDDGTDAFGGYSQTCLRCDRSVYAQATSTFRGTFMSVAGTGLIFESLTWAHDAGNEYFGLVCGGLLFLLGLLMIWRRW